jgi:hypothetical protein
MRSLAIIAGALLIGAAAHVSISVTGSYTSPMAAITAAVAFGLIVGAICIGRAWRERRFAIAWCLIASLVAGEAYAVILTAERVVATREAQQAPIRDAESARFALADRLAKAEATKKAANEAAIAKSAEKHCLANCRQLLQDQIAAAQAELDAARTALEALKPPASSTPLADRLGVAGWALDLITAALASIAANGLGAALVAFGAHGAHRETETPQTTTVAPLAAVPAPARSAIDHAARFGRAMLRPADVATPVDKLYAAYLDWCHQLGSKPYPPQEIGGAMNRAFMEAGLRVERINGTPHVIGAKLKTPQRRALGVMTPKAAQA